MWTTPLRAPSHCAGTAKASSLPPLLQGGSSSCQPCLSSRELTVDELVALDALLGIEVDDRGHQHALLIGAAGVDRQRLAERHRSLAFVDVAVQRQERLIAVDGGTHGLGPDGAPGAPPVHELEVG